jgi:hypothetical protein
MHLRRCNVSEVPFVERKVVGMTDASPGPGYWMASDGKWYPPEWEYCWFTRVEVQLGDAMTAAQERASQLGQQGWEMVNHTVQGTPGSRSFHFNVSAFFKRRVVR